MEKINIAELLKDCPKGMELDCTIYNGKVCFEGIDARNPACPIIKISVNLVHIERLDAWGQYSTRDYSKCVIFPKGKTTWEGFQRPFKDGDIVITTLGNIAIIRKPIEEELFYVYGIMVGNGFCKDETAKVVVERLATEEEKQKLFDAIKENGYKWDAETKTLEKLPKFKVGDRVRNKNYKDYIYDIHDITDKGYRAKEINSDSPILILFGSQEDNYELVPNKFDITTLIPFESRVLVRDCNQYEWEGEIFTRYAKSFNNCNFVTLGGQSWKQCIPYNDDTKHLLGTTDDCDEFYKTWE